MFLSDYGLNVRLCVLSALLMLCTSCSVTSSYQSVRVKRADDSTISEALSQKIKVRVTDPDGTVVDEFIGDKTVTVNALYGKNYAIELVGSDEMMDKCIYNRTQIMPKNPFDSGKLPATAANDKLMRKPAPFWTVNNLPLTSYTTMSSDASTVSVLSPTDTTISTFWSYDYPDTVTYYPDIRNTDECAKWLKDSGYSDEEIHKVFDKPYYLKTQDTEKEQLSSEDVEGGAAANGCDCTSVSTECER